MAHAVYPSADGSSALDHVVSAESIESLGGDAFDREALTLAEQSAGIGVWSIDLTTNRLRATAQFYRIMGVVPTGDTIPIETVRALRHPDDRDRVLAGFRQALQSGGDSYEIEYRIIRPDGNVRWIFGRGRVFRDRNGEPIRYSGVDLDITDRKATEAALSAAKQELERMNQVLEQRVRERTTELVAEAMRRAEAESHLRQAQKMQAVGQLTGGIAHDFNNVLQVIIGNLENVRLTLERDAKGDLADQQRNVILRATATATRAAQSATELVARLLAFGREQPLAPQPLDVNVLVGEMMAMIARVLGESIQIETALAPGVWIVRIDRNQLESALLNLIVNARDAMPAGGRLVIGTVNTDVREDDVLPGRYVMLSVRDTGSGIAPEHLPQVFKPFFTTKVDGKGSGLGLAMVHGFVKQSGGHVRVRSEQGSGTTVEIFLPVAPATAAPCRSPGRCLIRRRPCRRTGVGGLPTWKCVLRRHPRRRAARNVQLGTFARDRGDHHVTCDHFVDPPDSGAARRSAKLALQPRLGILPQRNRRSRRRGRRDTAPGRRYLIRFAGQSPQRTADPRFQKEI